MLRCSRKKPILLELCDAKKNPKGVEIISGEDPLKRNIKKLFKGRIGAIVDDLWVVKYNINKTEYSFEQLTDAGKVGKANKVLIGFTPAPAKAAKVKEYIKIFDEGLDVLKKTGELDEILEKYGVEYWIK